MEAIRVLIRVRPFLNDIEYQQQQQQYQSTRNTVPAIQISSDQKTISVHSNRSIQCRYDHVFHPQSEQNDVYQHAKYVVEAVLTGKNGTIFAYGQTGSGKSYSMFGADGGIDLHPGIVPRCIHDIFLCLAASSSNANTNKYKSSVYVSFLQVYNEQVFDMFQSKGLMKPLDIREKDGDVVVVGLKQYYTQNLEQCLALIKAGLQNRTVRETSMNHASSRSHSILQIMIEQERDVFLDCGTGNSVRRHERICSKLNLCDLAGSERWGVAGMGDEQISELTNINSSLHTLGRCIAALAKQSQSQFHSRQDSGNGGRERVKFSPKKVHIPFRDSKLTRVLQDSLGGNTKTCLLATLNPSVVCGDENICTLRFADRAHQVRGNMGFFFQLNVCLLKHLYH